MSVVGGKDQDTTTLGFDLNILAIEQRFTALKVIIQVADNTDITGGDAIGDFNKTAGKEQIIHMALVTLPW